MAASIKISELNSLTNLTDVDLFLVSDMETGTSRKISYTNLKSNVITELSTAVTDLTTVVSQNKSSAETLVENVRTALEALVASNVSTLVVDDNALGARIATLELDPVTKSFVETKVAEVIDLAPDSLNTLNELAEALGDDPTLVSGLVTRVTSLEADPTTATALAAVQADVDQNESDADAAIAAVQTQLTQIQTEVNNLDIDIAPETLNSINELAAALGDDPQIIPNLQAELTAYKAHIEERNLELALAYDVPVYIETLQGG